MRLEINFNHTLS